jgi:methionyl-tRNA formyltransferase
VRLVLLTGERPEQNYVARVFASAFGEELRAIVVARPDPTPLGRRIRRYWRRYSVAQLVSRARARAYRRRHGLDLQRTRTLTRILTNEPAPADLYTIVASHNGDDCKALLRDIEPDVIAVYGTSIIRDPVLQLARLAALNMHTGLSPRYRGSDTIFWPLHNEEPEWVGVTIHELTAGIDAGPILATGRPEIEADDDEDALFAKAVQVGTELFVREIRKVVEGKADSVPQDLEAGREYRFVDRTATAERRVRALLEAGLLRRFVPGGE